MNVTNYGNTYGNRAKTLLNVIIENNEMKIKYLPLLILFCSIKVLNCLRRVIITLFQKIKVKFFIVEPSPLPIRISLGPKYSPLDPVFKYLQPDSSLNLRDHVSHGKKLKFYVMKEEDK